MKKLKEGKVSFLGGQATDYVAQIALTPTDLTTLSSANVAIIKAPGVGRAIQVERAIFQFNYGGVPYTGGGTSFLFYHGDSGFNNVLSGVIPAALMTGTADATFSFGAPASALTLKPNAGIDMVGFLGDFAAGNSSAVLTVWYTVYRIKP